ncbi:DJ-1/PfpI family protein [Herbidospora mongoliensis]|uniref:DJ-1/PfpI family protein n=1 Tax=Herbidospora mongoliensis TaxID=688067 RepID=UPI0008367CF4|nr:DJ-1/PfpI family protein [Herbidospora mongoliensis]
MSLAQQKVVVLAYPGYQELDFWYPVLRSREEGATVHIVAAAAGAESILGYPVIPDTDAADLDPASVSVIIAPGVAPWDLPQPTGAQIALVTAVHAAGGHVAFVGNGASVVAQAIGDTTERVIAAESTDDLTTFFAAVRQTV